MTRQATRAAGLSLEELRILAPLEGKPLPRGRDLADALGMSPTAAWSFIRRMKRIGVLNFVSPVRLRSGVCECISYIQAHAVTLADLDALESRMVLDPSVMVAARVTGRYDYRLFSRHRDYRAANEWSRGLEADPSVTQVVTRFCETVVDRPRLAAAILGSADGAARASRAGVGQPEP